MKLKVIGYVLNDGPVPTKTHIYGVESDFMRPNCSMVAARCYGWLLWIRAGNDNIHLDEKNELQEATL